MKDGSRRGLIPLAYRDLATWPGPDIYGLPPNIAATFTRRRTAVEMYASGSTYDEIWKKAGICKSEVERFVKRCISIADDGRIWGFTGLLPNVRLVDYERTATVVHHKGGGHGHCAGALNQIFRRHPDLRDLVERLYLGKASPGEIEEARMPITRIHARFKKELRRRGFTDYDWPFNTDNVGYQALWLYCKAFRLANAQLAATSRSGVEAARRVL